MSILPQKVFALLLSTVSTIACVQAAEDPVIRGKHDWLFVNYEIPPAELTKEVDTTLVLIKKLNRMLANSHIALTMVVVPSKIEIYAHQLPDDFKISDYMSGFNNRVQTTLLAGNVATIDLKPVLRKAATQNTDAPVFYRLDTHWSPTGAMLAAQTIQAGIAVNPYLQKALETVPVTKYTLAWASKKESQTTIRDITQFIPTASATYPPEDVLRFKVNKLNEDSLLGSNSASDIGLVGSSLSGEWTGFADALRYNLQHDLVNFSINADVGPWAVMRAYLRDDAFQVQKPKLIIWELPERAIGILPNYKFRPDRFKIDNNDWLLQVAALSQNQCVPVQIMPKVEATGLLSKEGIRAGSSTTEADFVEISFDKPVTHLSYLSARVTTAGSKQIMIEASGAGIPLRKFAIEMPGDDVDHALKTPLGLSSKGVTRIKLYPGNTTAFAVADIEVCNYQEDWLK